MTHFHIASSAGAMAMLNGRLYQRQLSATVESCVRQSWDWQWLQTVMIAIGNMLIVLERYHDTKIHEHTFGLCSIITFPWVTSCQAATLDTGHRLVINWQSAEWTKC